jgi:hypothetical protein
MPGKGYDKYILLHTGHNAYFNDPKKAPDNLSKALAADILKMSDNIKFDVNTIHKVADNIKKMPEYKENRKEPGRAYVKSFRSGSSGKYLQKHNQEDLRSTTG